MRSSLILFLLCSICTVFYACRKDPPFFEERGYPEDIAKILVLKCATSGCHNAQSKDVTSGLSLETWDEMFKGNNSGAVVIPFSPENSTLMFFINTHDDLGPKLSPTMPYNEDPLSREEQVRIRDWIAQGAPDRNGFVKFSDNPQRKKIYVVNQGTDLVSVIDKASGLVMRYVKIGTLSRIEAPHMIRVSPDDKHWYVVFNSGPVIQKFRTTDDQFVGQLTLSSQGQTQQWNSFVISDDSKSAYAVDWSGNGTILRVNLETMKLVSSQRIGGNSELRFPHGSAVNKAFTTLYVTAQTGNFIYKIDISDPFNPVIKTVVLQPGEIPNFLISRYDPHEVLLSPDESKYFVTCQKTNELRIFSAANDSLLQVIRTGDFPQEMAVSVSTDYLFVSCPEDLSQAVPFRPISGKGAVSVINYKTNTLVKNVYTGFQPHGIAVDDLGGKVYVANRNQGQASHHSTNGKSNGNMTTIDLHTLFLIPNYKPELSVDPYSIAIRP